MKQLIQGLYLIGRIKYSISKVAHIKSAPIVVDDNYITHVGNAHKTELSQLNITAYDYLKLIADNFDKISRCRAREIMLIKTNPEKPSDTCIIELYYSSKKALWQVRTAQPRRTIKEKDIIWRKPKRGSRSHL